MGKSEVYSWRVSPDLKAALEERTRGAGKSVGRLLDELASAWLDADTGDAAEERAREDRIRQRARRCFGSIRSGERTRAERAREIVRERIQKAHG